jgi:hypothetical protein
MGYCGLNVWSITLTHPVGRMVVMLVWHLVTASVIIMINPTLQLHFQSTQSLSLC